jgi:Tripartite tricarboxylate transporter family receptor/Putative peptidoglycan binding domain
MKTLRLLISVVLLSVALLPLTSFAFTFTQPLSLGDRGSDVSALQQLLKNKGYFTYPEITGYYGSNTWKAVAAFQQANVLDPVGFVGPKTRALINSGELFKAMAGVDLFHVPYRGSAAARTDIISGQVQVLFDNLPPSLEYIKAGQTRALAVTTATRSEALPDIPTVSDFVPGYEASLWWGVGAPKNTPAEIVTKLNKEINFGLADPNMKARITQLGAEVLMGTPADFSHLIAADTEKWGKVIRAANIKPQ